MANECPTIIKQVIRSQVTIEGLSWGVPGTPEAQAGHVLSININRSRGNPIATMSCTLETWVTSDYNTVTSVDDANLGPCIRVWAGQRGPDGSIPQLFTGYVKDTKITPHWDDMRKVVLEISAEDVFSRMRNHKISRRFRLKDSAYAVITSGQRRQGGRMNQLKRSRERSGSHYQPNALGGMGDQFGDHSPLIRTPDPFHKSPKAARPYNKSRPGTDDEGKRYIFQPRHLVMKPGDKALVRLIDERGNQRKVGKQQDGLDIDINSYKSTCLCYISPSFSTGAGSVNQVTSSSSPAGFKSVDIIQGGASPGSIKILQGNETFYNDELMGSFIVEMRDWYPFKIMYIDPETKSTAEIDVSVVYPHTHRGLSDGGPTVSVYDSTIVG